MRTTLIASFIALAAAAPLDFPTLATLPTLPEVGAPSLPEVGTPSVPEIGGLPSLPNLPVELPKLPVKRDGLGIPAVPGVGLPEELKNLLDGKKGLPEVHEVPEIELPEHEVPEIELPEHEVPEIELPEHEVPEVPEAEVPEVPEVEVPQVPEAEVEVEDSEVEVEISELPVKRDGLGTFQTLPIHLAAHADTSDTGIPALPGVGLPEEVKDLLNGVPSLPKVPEVPVKRNVPSVEDPEVHAKIEKVIEVLTALLAHTPETPETPEIPTLPQPRKRDGLGVPAVSSSASVMYRM
tara:strand:+ start:16374 stop:17255 length:882 start_codon:yes stop_codon:yes gene_type:complete